MIFEKEDVVRIETDKYQVICADEDIAVLGRLSRNIDDPTIVETDFTSLVAYANGDEFKDLLGDYEILSDRDEGFVIDETKELEWISEKLGLPEEDIGPVINAHYDYLKELGLIDDD